MHDHDTGYDIIMAYQIRIQTSLNKVQMAENICASVQRRTASYVINISSSNITTWVRRSSIPVIVWISTINK